MFSPSCFPFTQPHAHTCTCWHSSLAGAATQYEHCGRAENSTLRNKCAPVCPTWDGCIMWVSSWAPVPFSPLSGSVSVGLLLIFQRETLAPLCPVSCRERTCRTLFLKTWPRGCFLLWWRVLVPSLSSGILVSCASVCFWFNAALRMSCIPKLLCRKKGKYVISASWNLQGERRDQA